MSASFSREWLVQRTALFATVLGIGIGSSAGCSGSYQNTDSMYSSPDTNQQIVLITGSTGGLGREVALRVASSGAHVIVHGRNVERGNEVVAQIEAEGKGSARFFRADLADLNAVREFAETIRRNYDRLDILINNAGIVTTPSRERELSADGYELLFAVNYLSGFLLTRELLPLITSSAPGRIINVSSIAQRAIEFDDVMLEDDYSSGRAYAQSKLAQVMFTIDLADELEGTGVLTVSLHPASMMDTDMVIEDMGAQPRTSVNEGAEALMHLVIGTDLVNGQYYNGLNPGQARDQAYDAAARAQLRSLSEQLIADSID